jgi:DNA polymerase-3 subunit gamma/tau
MALLRMLAFRPEPPTGGSFETAPGPVQTPAGRPPPARAASDWPAIVASLGLQGPVTQLAAHCVLEGRKGDVVHLRLDPTGLTFRRPQLEQKLAQALSKHYGESVRLSITASDSEEQTPARAKAQAADERQRRAEQTIESDANVQALRDVFGATVQPGSVKPLN